jgi:hypothetical protein
MANRIWNTVSLVVALTAPLMLAAPLAAQTAECQPGDLVCGEVQVGPIDGRFRIGFGQDAPPPPPPPVVYQPPPPPPEPPVVYVQPPPPPPPQVVYQPPPQVVYQPPPQPVVYQQVPQPQLIQRRVRYELVPRFDIGLHLNVGAMATDRGGFGGGGAGLRIRPIEWFAIDITAGIYGGQAYGGQDHWEVPVLADLIFFFNPGDRLQVYGLVGGGIAFGENGRLDRSIGSRDFIASRSLFYVGGEAGLGLEWRMARHFAMNFDVRGFMREQLGGAPEFTESTGIGTTRSTNTSAGVYGNLGMTFYFIGL